MPIIIPSAPGRDPSYMAFVHFEKCYTTAAESDQSQHVQYSQQQVDDSTRPSTSRTTFIASYQQEDSLRNLA